MAISREVIEGRQWQGTDEQIAYVFVLPTGTSPENPAVALYDVTGGARVDVTATKLTGSPLVVGDEVTSPAVHDLAEGRAYRLHLAYETQGNIFSVFALIDGEF